MGYEYRQRFSYTFMFVTREFGQGLGVIESANERRSQRGREGKTGSWDTAIILTLIIILTSKQTQLLHKSALVVHNANGRWGKLLGLGENSRDIDSCWQLLCGCSPRLYRISLSKAEWSCGPTKPVHTYNLLHSTPVYIYIAHFWLTYRNRTSTCSKSGGTR